MQIGPCSTNQCLILQCHLEVKVSSRDHHVCDRLTEETLASRHCHQHGFKSKEKTAAKETSKGRAGNVEEQIKTLQEEGRQAALKGDTSFLEKYLADDYIGVGGDGRVFTKTESIQRRKSGAVKIESIDELALKIRMYGDTAVVNSLASVRGIIDGKPLTGDSRATFVWVKQKGIWKEVAFQLTPVAPASK